MLSLQEGEGTVACNQSPGTTPRNHTTSLRHHTTPLLQPQKLSNQTHQEEWHYTYLYLCLFIYLFVLNEIFPIVSFLVGYVENYFQILVCWQIISDQKWSAII